MKAVFDTKPGSGYDDEVTQRYHFPYRYAAIVNRVVDDWVVLRRPRADGGNLAYFAAARVARVDPDASAADRAYARLADFLPFDEPVPWLVADRYAEEALRQQPRHQVGLYLRGRSVRPLQDADFSSIVALGLRDTTDPVNAHRYGLEGISDDLLGFGDELPPRQRAWQIQVALTNRIVREASFRRNVCRAYDDRCAITGLRLINGGGRSEVHAAHILPVASGGPDVIQNGIALSATVHWLFDRHLITLTNDYKIIVAHNRVPSELQSLFVARTNCIHLPEDRKFWPHESYLAQHREAFAGM